MIQNSSVRNRPRPSAASSEANASAGGGAAVELRRELGDLGAAARRERREHQRARVDLRRQILGHRALVEIAEHAGLVERGVRGDHAGAIAIEAERERGGDRDAIEHLVGALDPLLGVEAEVGRLVRVPRRLGVSAHHAAIRAAVSASTSSAKPRGEAREPAPARSRPRGGRHALGR